MATNNPIGLGDSADKFTDANTEVTSKLTGIEASSNSLLNISKQTDPTVSNQGSKDSVATSYGIMGTSKGFVDSSKVFAAWVFTGTTGKMLISIFAGMFGLASLYFITKWIRQGA